MIGKGRLYNNLYILEHTSHSSSFSAHASSFCGSFIADGPVWHQRLGHPAATIQQKLSSFTPFIKTHSSHDFQCKIYPLAKQKRLAYISHNNLSIKPFDLVHLDIWGPFSGESIEGFKYFFNSCR